MIADLLDLQFELNSLQQGIHQMDKITPENPVPSTDDLFETDPFGDSFANMKVLRHTQTSSSSNTQIDEIVILLSMAENHTFFFPIVA